MIIVITFLSREICFQIWLFLYFFSILQSTQMFKKYINKYKIFTGSSITNYANLRLVIIFYYFHQFKTYERIYKPLNFLKRAKSQFSTSSNYNFLREYFSKMDLNFFYSYGGKGLHIQNTKIIKHSVFKIIQCRILNLRFVLWFYT